MEESIYYNKNIYQAELKRIEKAEITKKNKEIILKYHSHLLSENISQARVIKLSTSMRRLALLLKKDFDTATEEDIRRVITEILNNATLTPATKSDYRRNLKQFYRYFEGKGKFCPDKVAWIKVKIKSSDRPKVDLITPEEITKVIDHCTLPRDKAFLSLLFTGGFRIGEMLGMRIRDWQNHQNFAKVNVTGKTGPRTCVIASSAVAYVNQYLSIHPHRDDKNAYLWVTFGQKDRYSRLRYVGARKLLQRAFIAAGVHKQRLYLHLFRKSSATMMASHLTEPQMRKYYGWTDGSDTPASYVFMSGRDVDNAVLRVFGLEKQERKEEETLKNIHCTRCNTLNPATAKYCSVCGLALTLKVALETEDLMKEETNKTFQLLMEIMKNPELLKQFEKFKKATT